jgi:hypothetical protein
MSTCRIASVHFAPVTAKRNYRGQAYRIPAATLGGEPVVIEVRDLIQRDWGSMLAGTNKRQEHRWPVLGEEIAHCLVGEWTGTTSVGPGMNPQCHPGIWVVRDRLPVTETTQKGIIDGEVTYEERMVLDAENKTTFRAATPGECAAMWAEDLAAARSADRQYAEWCWRQGNHIVEIWRRGGEPVPREMPPVYKMAAKQYGLEAEWLKEAAASDSRQCPHCGALGSKHTFICAHCTQPTDLEKWAQFQAQKDAALRDAKKMPLPPPLTSPGHQAAA